MVDPLKWGLFEVDPLKSWVSGRVIVIGDAVRGPVTVCIRCLTRIFIRHMLVRQESSFRNASLTFTNQSDTLDGTRRR